MIKKDYMGIKNNQSKIPKKFNFHDFILYNNSIFNNKIILNLYLCKK